MGSSNSGWTVLFAGVEEIAEFISPAVKPNGPARVGGLESLPRSWEHIVGVELVTVSCREIVGYHVTVGDRHADVFSVSPDHLGEIGTHVTGFAAVVLEIIDPLYQLVVPVLGL